MGLFDPTPQAKPLREHQVTALSLLKRSIGSGNRRIVVQMPTGAGKTRTAAEIVSGALGKGNRVAFTVPAISLVDQTVAAFESEGIDAIGVIQACHPRTNHREPVQVVSVQSLARRQRPEATVVIVDECHIRSKAIQAWMDDEPNKIFIGLSATPWRRGMASEWQDLVIPVRMQELIDQGFLSPFRVFAPSHPDLSGVKIVAGDYHEGQLAEVMGGGGLVADVVETWLEKGRGLPTLVFAVNRAHAAHLVEQFAGRGVRMGYCDAFVDLIERKVLFDRLARGDIEGIVNVGTLTTGVDADVRCIVIARPTKSEMLHVQIIGRALRTAPGKDHALLLDHADNHARLGFVTDIHHPTLLAGSDKTATRKERGEPMPKECGSCGVLKAPKLQACPSCGFKPTAQSGVDVEEGELVEFQPKPVKIDRDGKQRFYSELLAVAAQRGRSKGWAAHAYRDKTGVWPRGLSEQPLPPSGETLAWVRAKDIRFAKRRVAA